MPKEIAVVFSDSHLRAKTWSGRLVTGDSYHSFDQICSYAISHELPLIGAGDLIDKRLNEPSPIVYLSRKLRQLSKAGCLFYYTQGQHEIDEVPWMGLGGSKVVHLHKTQIELSGAKIYGLDYQSAETLKTELDAIPEDTDVLVAHQVWADFMGSICLPQGEFADIPHVRTLLTGDFHETVDETYRGKQGQKLQVFSPGSTYMQKIDEPDKKWFGILMSDGTVRKHALMTRVFEDFPIIKNEEDMEYFLSKFDDCLTSMLKEAEARRLPEHMVKPIIRVTFSHRVSDLTRRIDKLVGDRAHVFYKELPPERVESKTLARVKETLPTFKKGDSLTLSVMLPQAVDKKAEPEVFALAQRLLDAADPKLELSIWKKELLNVESS